MQVEDAPDPAGNEAPHGLIQPLLPSAAPTPQAATPTYFQVFLDEYNKQYQHQEKELTRLEKKLSNMVILIVCLFGCIMILVVALLCVSWLLSNDSTDMHQTDQSSIASINDRVSNLPTMDQFQNLKDLLEGNYVSKETFAKLDQDMQAETDKVSKLEDRLFAMKGSDEKFVTQRELLQNTQYIQSLQDSIKEVQALLDRHQIDHIDIGHMDRQSQSIVALKVEQEALKQEVASLHEDEEKMPRTYAMKVDLLATEAGQEAMKKEVADVRTVLGTLATKVELTRTTDLLATKEAVKKEVADMHSVLGTLATKVELTQTFDLLATKEEQEAVKKDVANLRKDQGNSLGTFATQEELAQATNLLATKAGQEAVKKDIAEVRNVLGTLATKVELTRTADLLATKEDMNRGFSESMSSLQALDDKSTQAVSAAQDQASDAQNQASRALSAVSGVCFPKHFLYDCPDGSSEVVLWHWYKPDNWDPHCGGGRADAVDGICMEDKDGNWMASMLGCCRDS